MGLRKAEIQEDAVAKVFGNMAFKAFHLSGTRFLVDAHDLAQFLRIEAFRKFSRPETAAERRSSEGRRVPAFGALGRRDGGQIGRGRPAAFAAGRHRDGCGGFD